MLTEQGLKKAIRNKVRGWKAFANAECVAEITFHGDNKWLVKLKGREKMKVENEEIILKLIATHESDPKFDTEYVFGDNGKEDNG
mgnify:CR=1 FL=1